MLLFLLGLALYELLGKYDTITVSPVRKCLLLNVAKIRFAFSLTLFKGPE